MTSILAKSLFDAAIAASDWLLACTRRDPDKYQTLFNQFYKVLKPQVVNQDVFNSFLGVFDEVMDILTAAKESGGITMNTGGRADNVRTFQQLFREAEDFYRFLLVFGHTLDQQEAKDADVDDLGDKHLCMVIFLFSVEQPGKPHRFPELRIKLMMIGFNMLHLASPFRYAVCMTLNEYAQKKNLFSLLLPYIQYIESWLRESPLEPFQRRKLFSHLASQVELAAPHQKSDIFRLWQIVIAEYEDDDDEFEDDESEVTYLALMQEHACRFLLAAIKWDEFMLFETVLSTRAVQQLPETSHRLIYELGDLFYSGNSAELTRFHEKCPECFKNYDIDFEQCVLKMHLLELCRLACAREDYLTMARSDRNVSPASGDSQSRGMAHDLALDFVARSLGVTQSEAEELAVQAIAMNLVDGHIDQINSRLLIRSSLRPQFQQQQWTLLHDKLTSMVQNVEAVIKLMSS